MSNIEKVSNRAVMIDGRRMTVPERDMMMKLDYINGGLTMTAIGEKYNLRPETVGSIAKRYKWKQAKKELQEQMESKAEEKLIEVYANCGVEINMMYNNTWQKIINLCNDVLNDPEKYMTNKQGELRFGVLQVLADVIEKAQKGQQFTTGFIGREACAKLELQREMVTLRKKLVGEDDNQVIVEDNFLQALTDINKDLWEEN